MTRTRRQSRRQSDFDDAVDTEETASTQPTARPSFSANDMASIMATLQQTQTAAFERLLDRVLEHETRRESLSTTLAAAPSPAAASAPAPLLGNFAKCTARFSGAPGDSLDGFVDAMESYKECAHVGDDNALRGLSMLLTGDAAVWWQGIKSTITTWSEAVTSLRSAFGDTRPPHRIYLEIFGMTQGREKTEIFVAKARALFARLPAGDVNEKVQLDMLFGLLHHRVRERLRRDEVTTYDELLQKARQIEDAADEGNDFQRRRYRPSQSTTTTETPSLNKSTPPPRIAPTPTLREPRGRHSSGVAGGRPSNSTAADARPATRDTVIRPAESDESASYNKKFCTHCRRPGHSRDVCFKLKMNESQDSVSVPTCYGCNAKGITRSNCKTCNSVAWYSYSHNKVKPIKSRVKSELDRVTTTKNCSVTMKSSGHFPHKNFINQQYFPTPSRVSMECLGHFSTVNVNDKNYSLGDSTVPQVRLRPTLSVQILGVRGKALLDSGAKSSVAGALLYQLLLKHKHPCEEATLLVRLADGSARTRRVLLTTLEVRINSERCVTLQFTIFPDAHNNETLFGMDFLVAAGIVLDFALSTWLFFG